MYDTLSFAPDKSFIGEVI